VDRHLTDTDGVTVCYFFFKDNEQQDNLATALCALVHQLFSHQHRLIHHAMPAWEKNGDRIRSEVNELWRIFLAAASDPAVGPVVCILDALDECGDEDRRRLITWLCDFYGQASTIRSGGIVRFLVLLGLLYSSSIGYLNV